jgi:hypothetical protein
MKSENQKFQLRPYTISELSDIYGVSKKTFRKWLEPFQNEIGIRNGFFYSVKQLQVIIDKLGIPSMLDLDEAA